MRYPFPVSVTLDIVRGDACKEVIVEAVYVPDSPAFFEDVWAFDEFGKDVELTEREYTRAVWKLSEAAE